MTSPATPQDTPAVRAPIQAEALLLDLIRRTVVEAKR